MCLCRRWLFTIIIAISSAPLVAQEADSLVLSQTADVLSFEDSLSIFNLIDSLLQNADVEQSQLAIRLSYNSNVLSAGRTLGIENFGLSPGVSFYHKSGIYADVSGYWSKDFDPSYYLTVASLGYMYTFPKYFSFMAGYDRYFYNVTSEDQYIPFKNTLSVTPILEFKPVVISLNYSYYFGDTYANRLMPGLGIDLQKKKFLKIDRITLSPSFYMLMGDETITELQVTYPRGPIELAYFLLEYKKPYKLDILEKRVFGIMNYAISVPLVVTHKNWGFSFTYIYNIPKALTDEPLTISESSYLSGSITYFIGLGKNKISLENTGL